MALVKSVRLLAVLSFAIFQVSFITLPANALAVERGHIGRDHVHAGIIKRQSGSSKRCKPRTGNDKPPTYANNNSTTHDNTPHATTTSTTTTSPQQTPTSTPSRGSKRILLWSNTVESSLQNFISANSPILLSNWKLRPYSAAELGASEGVFLKSNFLPQFWGTSDDEAYSKTLLGGNPVYPIIASINEPNQQSQKYMSPQDAANYWGQYIEPLAKFSHILSPAITADALDWMVKFMEACGTCSVYAMDIHAYEKDPAQIKTYANTFHQRFHRDVWFGEIACHSYYLKQTCDQPTFDSFYNSVVSFFDETEWIGGYGWFAFFPGDLPNGVGAANKMMQCANVNDPKTCYPNDLGKRYLAGN